ncbi:hypothetical protein ACWCQK_10530 [Streptomyces sp. NPDC002306]
MVDDNSPVYEVRYGWNLRTTGIVAVGAGFTAVLLVSDTPPLMRVLGLLLFGGGGVFMAFVALSRKVAFRVDETGVLLGGSPARYAGTTAHVPWHDITAVVLWRQRVRSASVFYVGVSRREHAPPLPGDGPRRRAVVEHMVPVPADVAIASRPMTGWRLDEVRLVTAVAHFAPDVPVLDHR